MVCGQKHRAVDYRTGIQELGVGVRVRVRVRVSLGLRLRTKGTFSARKPVSSAAEFLSSLKKLMS